MEKNFLGNDGAYQNIMEYLQLKNPGPILLEGPAGLGKTMAAYSIAASLLNCKADDLKDNNDFMLIGEGQSQIKVEDIHAVLSKSSVVGISHSGVKAYVILDGGNMTVQAQNMLLKLLEDQSQTNKVIFTCNGASPLETILSRCYHVNFRPVGDEHVLNYLKQKGCCQESLLLASGLCHGCPYVWDSISNAFSMLEDTYSHILNITSKTDFYGILHLLKEKDKLNFYECHADHWEEGMSLFIFIFNSILKLKLGLPVVETIKQDLSRISVLYTLDSTYKILQSLISHKRRNAYTKNDFFELVRIFVEA